MRIAFVHSSRETFRSSNARVRIGSGAENDLVVAGGGVAARHVAIIEDRRGLVLEVLPGAPHVYVNARPVRERALLRFGDHLNVGGSKLLLLPDDPSGDDEFVSRETANGAARPGFAALRAVAGTLSGRLLPVETILTLGSRGAVLPGVAGVCALQVSGDAVLLEAADSGVLVNGLPRKHGKLHSGDQLILGEHRFVVEAPSLQGETAAEQEAPSEPPPVRQPEARASGAEYGWLLGTAALLAVIIALLLWWRH
ncbi:MAG TPA: FHA domain-containing protein [Rhodanobacteraceae bacterium]|nr:FHA domain-containing protein [Rhodanobacteraceae bacterium]